MPGFNPPTVAAGITYWTESQSIASPNATTFASLFIATGSATNIDAAISPKGTGALQAHVADSTATGGNKRGTNAVDFQTSRATAAQVASGVRSVICGGGSNTASGQESAVVAGNLNVVSSRFSAALAGTSNTISGDWCASLCTTSSTLSGDNSVNLCGGSHANAGGRSAILCGQSQTINAGVDSTVILSGRNNNASSNYSVLWGQYVTDRGIGGSLSYSSGQYDGGTTAGKSQVQKVTLHNTTTSTTPTTLKWGNSSTPSGELAVANATVWGFTADVVFRTTAGDSGHIVLIGTVKRLANAASIAIVGTPTSTNYGIDAGLAGATVTAAVDTTNGYLQIQVTAPNSTSTAWFADVNLVQLLK